MASFFFFLDKLGPTVFAPVKMDFVGNIKVTPSFWQLFKIFFNFFF